MTKGHRAHLCASHSSLEEAIRDITLIARDGCSPTGGQRLTPLDEASWSRVIARLQSALERLTEAVRRLTPDYLEDRSRAEGLGGTLFRLAILVRHLQEGLVEGLTPEHMESRFGPLKADERRVLHDLVAGLRDDLSEVAKIVEELRTRQS